MDAPRHDAKAPGPGLLRGLGVEGRFLRSRVARRVFFSVVVCALLPITLFAVLSLHQVTTELRSEAEARLGEEAKHQGMAVLERLLLLQAALRVVGAGLQGDASVPPLEALPPELADLVQRRFTTLRFVPPDGEPALGSLDAGDRSHLAAGGALVRLSFDAPGRRILLALRSDGPAGPRLLVGEIEPAFLFAPEALRADVGLDVGDYTGRPVYRALAGGAALADLETPDDILEGSWQLFLAGFFRAEPWRLTLAEPAATALATAGRFSRVFVPVSVLALLAVGLATLVLVRRSLVPIEVLQDATRRMAGHDFGTRVALETGDEFQDLGRSFNHMAESIERHVRVMETVNGVGAALSGEPDPERLLDTILAGAMRATGAEAGALHLVQRDDRLARVRLRIDPAGLVLASAHDEAIPLACRPLVERLDTVAARSLRSGLPSAVLVPAPGSADAAAAPAEVLSLPMRNHEQLVIGVLQLVAPVHADTEPAFPAEVRAVAESLASQTAVALTKDRLAAEFRGLFEGLIQLIVKAIDAKSPYTGAHCRRVPILTEMIADAACWSREGPLADFALSEAERYELRIAALLHDCGKVTTPVHVVDKARKLETIFDRIHLVDTRFEVVRRDLELAHLRSGGGAEAEVALAQDLAALESDRDFLRRVNFGTEQMRPADQQRVRDVAARWSWRTPDGLVQPILDDEEVEHLTVVRGTLTEREREIINHHVVATIEMLEQLPYPRTLRNVPFIAGCHHERMDGQGYPNGYVRSQMSVQARILGLADVFEALTAKDRPYKRGMKVRRALEILGKMKDEGHIDPDLYEVFVRERVFLRYAAQYLDPEQLDDDLVEEAAGWMVTADRDPA